MELKFRNISAYRAIKEVYSHPKSWNFLMTFIDDSEEVEIDEDSGEIIFVFTNGKSDKNNYFTNENEYWWIGGYDNGKLAFLQLMHKVSKRHLELVIAQKKSSSKCKEWFDSLVKYLRQSYEFKYMTTYPMNEKLKEHYIASGFYECKDELRLDI